MTPGAFGLATGAITMLAFLPIQVALWPRGPDLGRDELGTFDFLVCDRCGKKVLAGAAEYHRTRCYGRPKEMRVASYRRQKW